ncbi:MAG TPA: response regulator transcription factor [Pseudomonadota bacterium]|jgi:DNA-binding response OmpR family regulator|nr:response regulator transcription factor [Deltaproteobacteria bacterium]HPH29253.1 response regulator transcription factor [Pseudomonadota bacterium]
MPPETLLIVEDDPAIRKALQMNLHLEGYRVLCAEDGEEGRRLCLHDSPDLMLIDLMLPRLSGIDLIRELRASDVECPMLVLSAKDQEADKVLALSIGADDYITKPFGLAELLARVRAALRRGRQQRLKTQKTQSKRVALDIAGRRVLVDGQPIETTAKEFDLLRLLSQHPGQVLTREQIMERIWGEHFTLRTIDNFIARLRGKIELNPDAPLHLETVRGVGYRYNP